MARTALLAADRRRDRKTADPRPRNRDLFENGFNQVTEATGPDGTTLFTWDDNGNQTAKTGPGGATTAYTWDARDRLSEIALPDGTTASYGYDTENLRVSMDDAGGARRILLDALEELGEYDEATGERVARFDHDPTRIDALLAQTTDAGSVAMLTDALGSVYGLADDAAAMRARYEYDVYGARSATLEEIGTRWGFTGHAISGALVNARARLLDPSTGGWLSEDPLNLRTAGTFEHPALRAPQLLTRGLAGNRYLYALGGPTRYSDPLGMQFEDLLALRVAAGAAAGVAAPRAPSVAHWVLSALFTLAFLHLAVDIAQTDAARDLVRLIQETLDGLGRDLLFAAIQGIHATRACEEAVEECQDINTDCREDCIWRWGPPFIGNPQLNQCVASCDSDLEHCLAEARGLFGGPYR